MSWIFGGWGYLVYQGEKESSSIFLRKNVSWNLIDYGKECRFNCKYDGQSHEGFVWWSDKFIFLSNIKPMSYREEWKIREISYIESSPNDIQCSILYHVA